VTGAPSRRWQEGHFEDRHHHLGWSAAARRRYPPREPDIGEVVFEVKNWSVYHTLHA